MVKKNGFRWKKEAYCDRLKLSASLMSKEIMANDVCVCVCVCVWGGGHVAKLAMHGKMRSCYIMTLRVE